MRVWRSMHVTSHRSFQLYGLSLLVACGPSFNSKRKTSSFAAEFQAADVTSLKLTAPQQTFCANSGDSPPLTLVVEHGRPRPLMLEGAMFGETREMFAFKSSAGAFNG